MTQQPALINVPEDDFEALKSYRGEYLGPDVIDGRVVLVPKVTTLHPRQRGILYPGTRLIREDRSRWTVARVRRAGKGLDRYHEYTLRPDVGGDDLTMTGAEMADFWRLPGDDKH